jgi:hypothetical protein
MGDPHAVASRAIAASSPLTVTTPCCSGSRGLPELIAATGSFGRGPPWTALRPKTVIGMAGRGPADYAVGTGRKAGTNGPAARMLPPGQALTVHEARLALPDLNDVPVRVLDVAERLAVLVLGLRDEIGSTTLP